MPVDRHEHPAEAAWYGDALTEAWPDIQAALDTHGAGFKKHQQEDEAHRAFERALRVLEATFGTPGYMIEALSADAWIPDGIDRQHLLHFAGRWKGRVESSRRIDADKGVARGEAGMVILHGNRNAQELTREEEVRRREEKKRNKKKKT